MPSIASVASCLPSFKLPSLSCFICGAGSINGPSGAANARGHNGEGTAVGVKASEYRQHLESKPIEGSAAYQAKVETLRSEIYEDSGEVSDRPQPLSKAALSRLNSVTGNDAKATAEARACLDAMKPEMRAKFVAMLEKEEAMNSGFALLDSGLSLEQWTELFGEGMPYPLQMDTAGSTEWEFVPLPHDIRQVGKEGLRNNDLRQAWGVEEDAQHTINIRDNIMENGLDFKAWSDWNGSGQEGRHRSSAGYSMGGDILHWSLIRFPVDPNGQNLL